MIKKLLQSIVVVFLFVSMVIALLVDESLSSGPANYYASAFEIVVYIYPLVAAFVVWEHNASRSLKGWSAVVGLVVTIALLAIGMSESYTTTGAINWRWFDGAVVSLYVFAFASSLSSAFGRILMLTWSLFRLLTARLKHRSMAIIG